MGQKSSRHDGARERFLQDQIRGLHPLKHLRGEQLRPVGDTIAYQSNKSFVIAEMNGMVVLCSIQSRALGNLNTK